MDSVATVLQMGDWMGSGWWMGTIGIIVWALLLAAIVFVVARLVIVPLVEGVEGGRGSDDSAMAVLRERYARGEIDDEEFERRAEALRQTDRGE